MQEQKPVIRELFIDELAEVKGGSDPLDRVWQFIRDQFVTTGGCNEEGPQC